MADTTDFRNGFTMIWNDSLWQIVKFQHVKPFRKSVVSALQCPAAADIAA